ncbi:MAG: ribbon-helix-helix protein, CopG family [Nostoc sp.]
MAKPRATLKDRTTSFRLPDWEIGVPEIAKKLNITQGELIRRAIREYAVAKGITL